MPEPVIIEPLLVNGDPPAASFVLYKNPGFLIQSNFADVFLLEIFVRDTKILRLIEYSDKVSCKNAGSVMYENIREGI